MESKNLESNIRKFTIELGVSENRPNYISELAKSQDPDNYILNPETGRYIKKNSAKGRKLLYGDDIPISSKGKVEPKFKINKISRSEKVDTTTNFKKDASDSNIKINLIGRKDPIQKKEVTRKEVNHEHKLIDLGQEISEQLLSDIEPPPKKNLAEAEPAEKPKRVIHYGGGRQVEYRAPTIARPDQKGIMYIYTDGAVSNNHNRRISTGGIGVFFGTKDPRNISEKFVDKPITNQRAELTAIIRAFQTIIKNRLHCSPEIKIVIYTDSMYSLNIITKQWRAKDNLDLVYKAWKLLKQIPNVELKHIRSHTNKNDIHSKGNAMADELARKGRDQIF